MALAPWNVLAQGRLRSDEEERKRQESGEGGRTFYVAGGKWTRSEVEIKASHALEKVAKEVGTDHVSAGMTARSLEVCPSNSEFSCHRVCDAEDSLRLPNHRRSEG